MFRTLSRFFLFLPMWWIVSAHAAPELPIWAAASWRNDITTVRAHIAAGTDVDTVDDWTGKTALHYAAEYGHLEIAELLLASGAAVDRRDDDQTTPLHFAAIGGFEEVVVLLLANGAEVNASDKAKERPMDGAVFFGHMNVANVLKDHFILKEFTLKPNYFSLEVTAFKPGHYGFLRKKKLFGPRELQIMSSEDLIQWRTRRIFNTSETPLVFNDRQIINIATRRFRHNQRFYQIQPYIEPPLRSPNRIDVTYETSQASWIDGKLDGDTVELNQGNTVINPGFEVVSDGQRAQKTFLSGGVTYAQFAEYNEGSWDGETDHSVSITIGWKQEGIYLIVVVKDDVHHHTKGVADEGDAVKVLFADSKRENIIGEYLFALVEPHQDSDFVRYKFVANAIEQWGVGYVEQLSGTGNFEVVMVRTPNTGTTIYEMLFSPETIGLESLQKNVEFGLGVAVIDSDPDAPGMQGWSGWGPESVVLEPNPAETALITLGGDPGDGGD